MVSIIIVTYNNENVIQQCLEALSFQTYTQFETIVIDNHSMDLTIDIVNTFLNDRITLVQSGENLGFTGGNILGLTHAKGELIVLLNPDTEPNPDWLWTLVQGINDHPEVGACASNLLVYGSDVIDSAGDGCTTTGRGFKHGEGQKNHLYKKEKYVFSACGGAMLIRKSLIDEIGFLDNDFFLIHEDTDFGFRIQLAGWKILFVPEAIVYHKVRSSIGHMSDTAVYYSVRNARFIWVKNMPFWLLLKYSHHHMIQEVGSFIFFCLKYQKWSAYWKANLDFFKLLPRMLKKRKEIQKNIKISTKELDTRLLPVFEFNFLKEKLKKVFS